MHPIRKNILKVLLFAKNKRFSEIKPKDMQGSLFTFHLDELIKEGLVIKNKSGEYSLSEEGKMMSNKYDFDSKTPTLQAKISMVVCPFRKNETEVLVYKRLKNPFYGCQGFMTGKAQHGETFVDAANRELLEETNLRGNPTLVGIRHYRVFDKKTKDLLEDKCMFIFKVLDPTGELKSNEEGEFQWLKIDELNNFVTNPLEEFDEIKNLVMNTKELTFSEVVHNTERF